MYSVLLQALLMHLYGLDELDGEDAEQTELFQDRLIELVDEKTLIAQVIFILVSASSFYRHQYSRCQ